MLFSGVSQVVSCLSSYTKLHVPSTSSAVLHGCRVYRMVITFGKTFAPLQKEEQFVLFPFLHHHCICWQVAVAIFLIPMLAHCSALCNIVSLICGKTPWLHKRSPWMTVTIKWAVNTLTCTVTCQDMFIGDAAVHNVVYLQIWDRYWCFFYQNL
jgi:hypothetical protein